MYIFLILFVFENIIYFSFTNIILILMPKFVTNYGAGKKYYSCYMGFFRKI